MASRIDQEVMHGEIDCRTRDRVTGKIWLAGHTEPLVLALAGRPWRDLAGRVLQFENPTPRLTPGPHPVVHQDGVVGDMTASRKVKVPDISLEEIGEYFAARKPFPWHWSNALYLEWFSRGNGRVVIESVDFRLTIGAETTWEMTTEEEAVQRQANNEAMVRFMTELGAAAEEGKGGSGDADEGRSISEEEADRMLEESERLIDRITGRLEREGLDEADFERILEEELERRRIERGEPPLSPREEKQRTEWIEQMNRAAEEVSNNPESEAEKDVVHPLSARAQQLTLRLKSDARKRGWLPEQKQPEHPIAMLINATMMASAKLAGALNGPTFPPSVQARGSVLARLNRAHRHLEDALLAADRCAEEKLVDDAWLAAARKELREIVAGLEPIMAELRDRLARGLD